MNGPTYNIDIYDNVESLMLSQGYVGSFNNPHDAQKCIEDLYKYKSVVLSVDTDDGKMWDICAKAKDPDRELGQQMLELLSSIISTYGGHGYWD